MDTEKMNGKFDINYGKCVEFTLRCNLPYIANIFLHAKNQKQIIFIG